MSGWVATRADERPASERRWEALRRHAARGAGRGLLLGATPTLLAVLLSPVPLEVARDAVAWWTVVGCATPLALAAWWASRRWRATQPPATGWGGVLIALAALLVFALGAVVTEEFPTALVGEGAAEN
ncbi:MAG: hypothetical protein ACRCYR_14055 [Phycicoccus sp.]